eukprot:TRINITY_DN8537_c0_g1_i1.p2 TRINITY_DN8537_c0_g1~~TRINITY_DN8537_c0_g1_i1.p2  ORF type:complete len:121 (+),score=0.45 TRINITY_DN8537_c0_g1_i1:96-458(+)
MTRTVSIAAPLPSHPNRTAAELRFGFLQIHNPATRPRLSCVSETAPDISTVHLSLKTKEESMKEVKLWGGRFEESVTEAVEKFSESISFDKALYKHDIMGSRAHATMLAKQVKSGFDDVQ